MLILGFALKLRGRRSKKLLSYLTTLFSFVLFRLYLIVWYTNTEERMGNSIWTIGVDLGGTKLDIGLVDDTGKVRHRLLLKTKAKEGAKAVIDDIAAAIAELRTKEKEANVLGVGIGMAGQIDKKSGLVRFAPNLKWHDVPLKQNLSQTLNLPVHVTNDVRAATWGEWLYGAGKGCDDILCIFVGTGIGGGVVTAGKMLEGCSNTAGEVGHMTIELNGPLCSCGNQGCFEALASGWAIAQRAKKAVARDPVRGKMLLGLAAGNTDELTARHVFQANKDNDPLAREIVDAVSAALVAGISGLVNAFNPKRVILGGGIIQGHPEFIEQIRQGISKHALKAAVEPLSVVRAELHESAGVIGAAAFALKASSV